MATKRKTKPMPMAWVFERIKAGTIRVDVHEGVVYRLERSTGTWWPLVTFPGGRSMCRPYVYVRVCHRGLRRGVSVHRMVWMYLSRKELPAGWEIHHKDGDEANNRWWNLAAMKRRDHEAIHHGETYQRLHENDATEGW